jgi:S1-C subfamily serine protease
MPIPALATPEWLAPLPHKAAVLLSWENTTCSGVAIGPREVLTAKHCVAKGKTEVFDQRGGRYLSQTILVRPNSEDVAVVILHPSVSLLDRAYVSKTSPNTGDLLFVAGFGCFSPTLDVRPVIYLGLSESGGMFLNGSICFGDSGGAVMTQSGELVGVVKARLADGRPGGVATRVLADWFHDAL